MEWKGIIVIRENKNHSIETTYAVTCSGLDYLFYWSWGSGVHRSLSYCWFTVKHLVERASLSLGPWMTLCWLGSSQLEPSQLVLKLYLPKPSPSNISTKTHIEPPTSPELKICHTPSPSSSSCSSFCCRSSCCCSSGSGSNLCCNYSFSSGL